MCLPRLMANRDGWSLCHGLEAAQRWGSEVLSLVRLGNLLLYFLSWYHRQQKFAECDLIKAFSLSWSFAFQLSSFYLFTLEPGFKGYSRKGNRSGVAASKWEKCFNEKHFIMLKILV